jgi:hypothetical protein
MERIVAVEITDIRSIKQVVLRPKALNAILGDNGQGKTSIILAIKAVFSGGHSPLLRRQLPDGTYVKKASVKLTGDDGTTILKVIREKTSELTVTSPTGVEIPGPQEYVENLAHGFSFDPLQFIEAKPKERAAYLQRALNLTFTVEEVSEIAGPYGLSPAKPVDLDGLDALRKAIYEARTKVNGAAKEANGTVSRLSKALEEDEKTDWDTEVQRIQGEREQAIQAWSDGKQAVKNDADAARQQINLAADEEIARINRERSAALLDAAAVESDGIGGVEAEARPVIERLNQELGTAQANAKKKHQMEVFRAEVEQARKASEGHEVTSTGMTAALKALDFLKASKLESLPIPGADFRGGEFYVNGLPFDSLNDGQKFLTAFQVAALMPGDLGVLIADRAEILGPDNWQAFQDAALQSGFQVFVTRVQPGPLEVKTL